MKKKTGYIEGPRRNGFRTVTCYSWTAFQNFISKGVKYSEYIYRGQASSKWGLITSLDRALNVYRKNYSKKKRDLDIEEHLQQFKASCRGRGVYSHISQSGNSIENEWWALGQHHGLFTPLLDWTSSPYVAAFFSFLPSAKEAGTQYRVIWSLHKPSVEERSKNLAEKKKGSFFVPENDEHSRLLAQGGLFSRIPIGTNLKSWVIEHFKGEKLVILDRILVPSSYRTTALTHLNRMHINHTRLFPDLGGAASSTNMKFQNQNY